MTMWEAGPEREQPPVVTVPVVPGSSGASGRADQPPQAVVRRPRWVVPALVAMGAVTLAALAVTSWTLGQAGGGGTGGSAPAVAGPTLREAHASCGSKGDLADGGRTLDLDMKGEELGSGELTWAEVKCYLNALNTPAYVVRHMQSTRALDGRQTDTWGSFEASWIYHPDDGLDVLIRQIS